MSESEPIPFRPCAAGPHSNSVPGATRARETPPFTAFSRQELDAILALYGRKVAAGEWRDYAIDMGRDTAVFSIYRRAAEWPLYRIEKSPRLARRQGTYSVMAPAGLILKRGHDLQHVLGVLDTGVRAVE